MSSFQEYWDAIPPVTRGYLSGSLLMTSLISFKMLSYDKVLFIPDLIIFNFEIWRLLTNFFFFGPFSFGFLMQMLLLGRFGAQVENDPFRTPNGGTADFVYCLLLMAGALNVMGYAIGLYAMGGPLVFALVYLWSRKNPDAPVSVWGFRFKGSNLPWVFLAFNVLTGQSPIPDLCGLIAGHLYYFLVEVLPLKYGRSFISTPGFVVALTQQLIGENFNHPAVQRGQPAAPAPRRHDWGQGRRLGG